MNYTISHTVTIFFSMVADDRTFSPRRWRVVSAHSGFGTDADWPTGLVPVPRMDIKWKRDRAAIPPCRSS